jgi:hypothetical protein
MLIRYYSSDLLAFYQSQSHIYEVRVDEFEGQIRTRSDHFERALKRGKESYISVMFTLRKRKNGEDAIAAYQPDVDRSSGDERRKWESRVLPDDEISLDHDPRFERWLARYIHGDWDVDNGVMTKPAETVDEINAVAKCSVGAPLFKFPRRDALRFPTTESDHAYQDSHAEAYKWLVDGLDKETITKVAVKLGKALNFNNDNTVNALRRLATPSLDAVLFQPLELVSSQRREADHGVRQPAMAFGAFEQFSRDMLRVLAGLEALRLFLASELRVEVESCVRRIEAMSGMPEIDLARKSQANYSISQLTQVIGKRVANVETGFGISAEGRHDREVIIFRFEDGSALGIDTCCDAQNLESSHKGLTPEELHVWYLATFVPAIKRT